MTINQCKECNHTTLVCFLYNIIEIIDISELKQRYGNIRLPSNYELPKTPAAAESSDNEEDEEADDLAAGMYCILFFYLYNY